MTCTLLCNERRSSLRNSPAQTSWTSGATPLHCVSGSLGRARTPSQKRLNQPHHGLVRRHEVSRRSGSLLPGLRAKVTRSITPERTHGHWTEQMTMHRWLLHRLFHISSRRVGRHDTTALRRRFRRPSHRMVCRRLLRHRLLHRPVCSRRRLHLGVPLIKIVATCAMVPIKKTATLMHPSRTRSCVVATPKARGRCLAQRGLPRRPCPRHRGPCRSRCAETRACLLCLASPASSSRATPCRRAVPRHCILMTHG